MIRPRPADRRHGGTGGTGGRHRAPGPLASGLRRSWPAGAVGLALGLVLLTALPGAGSSTAGTPGGASPAAAVAPRVVLGDDVPVASADAPVRVQIPSIGVDSRLVDLGIGEDGALVPPADFARAGWFTQSPVPGDVGPSVIAGHVDSVDGPAVFYRLRDLAPGDEVLVELAGGTTVRFTVSGTEIHPKDRFPTESVYGPTHQAELRLITCGGEFDADRRSYRDNVVVTAVRDG